MKKVNNTFLIGLIIVIFSINLIFDSLFTSEFRVILYTLGLYFLVIGLIAFSVGCLILIMDIYRSKKQNYVEIVRALGNIGKNSEMTVITLQEALRNPNKNIRREAALSLGKIGNRATIAIPSLINALQDKNPEVRWRASETLGLLGVKSDEVIESLKTLIHDECDYVCESAIMALDNLTE